MRFSVEAFENCIIEESVSFLLVNISILVQILYYSKPQSSNLVLFDIFSLVYTDGFSMV